MRLFIPTDKEQKVGQRENGRLSLSARRGRCSNANLYRGCGPAAGLEHFNRPYLLIDKHLRAT